MSLWGLPGYSASNPKFSYRARVDMSFRREALR
jgi:hypothetical protein